MGSKRKSQNVTSLEDFQNVTSSTQQVTRLGSCLRRRRALPTKPRYIHINENKNATLVWLCIDIMPSGQECECCDNNAGPVFFREEGGAGIASRALPICLSFSMCCLIISLFVRQKVSLWPCDGRARTSACQPICGFVTDHGIWSKNTDFFSPGPEDIRQCLPTRHVYVQGKSLERLQKFNSRISICSAISWHHRPNRYGVKHLLFSLRSCTELPVPSGSLVNFCWLTGITFGKA